MEEAKEEYKVLTYVEFFEKYNKSAKESRFISRSFSQTSNAVAIFVNELIYDVYFQCPDFGEEVVPDDRRYIYWLPANTYKNVPHTLKEGNGKEKISVKITDLKVFADPYSNFSEAVIGEDEKDNLIAEIKELIRKYEEGK